MSGFRNVHVHKQIWLVYAHIGQTRPILAQGYGGNRSWWASWSFTIMSLKADVFVVRYVEDLE